MPKFFNVLPPDEALQALLERLDYRVDPESVPASEALGRVLYDDVASGEDLPAFLNGKGRGPQRDGRPQSHGSVKGSAQNVGAKREERTFSKRAIGIDLGTTNSAVAIGELGSSSRGQRQGRSARPRPADPRLDRSSQPRPAPAGRRMRG